MTQNREAFLQIIDLFPQVHEIEDLAVFLKYSFVLLGTCGLFNTLA